MSKVTGADGEIRAPLAKRSPGQTLAVELKDHLSPKLMIQSLILRTADRVSYAPIGSKGREFDEETAKDLNGLLPSSQPDPK